jgi:hypothetical protein
MAVVGSVPTTILESPSGRQTNSFPLRHLDGDAEEAESGLATSLNFAPRRVAEIRLAPDAIDARAFADALAVERGQPRHDWRRDQMSQPMTAMPASRIQTSTFVTNA